MYKDSLCSMTHCVEWLIEAGEALAPASSVCGGVVGVAPKQLDAQDHEDEDEQEQQQHEVPQRHHTLHDSTQHLKWSLAFFGQAFFYTAMFLLKTGLLFVSIVFFLGFFSCFKT